MVRLVADTNAVVSGFLWTGPPAKVIQLAEIEHIQLISSNELIDELVDVLTRRKFNKRLEEIGKTPEAFIANYRALIELIEPEPLPRPVSDDPDDDAVLACAVKWQSRLYCYWRQRFTPPQGV